MGTDGDRVPKKTETARLRDKTLMSLPMNPPTPIVEEQIRDLGNGWKEYATSYGRAYYHNEGSGERSWKPPRKNMRSTSVPQFGSSEKISQRSGSHFSLNVIRRGDSLPLTKEMFLEGNDLLDEPQQVGKILRVGKLNTARVKSRKKKKWTSSFTVLTEYYLICTAVTPGTLRVFRKVKTPSADRFYLPNATIEKEDGLSKRKNVYKLTTKTSEVLIESKNAMEAETWFHAIKLVIAELGADGEVVLGQGAVSGFVKGDSEVRCREIKYPTPPGWTDVYDATARRISYVHGTTGEKWYSSTDDAGRVYFFENKTGRSSWLLPSSHLPPQRVVARVSVTAPKSKVTDV